MVETFTEAQPADTADEMVDAATVTALRRAEDAAAFGLSLFGKPVVVEELDMQAQIRDLTRHMDDLGSTSRRLRTPTRARTSRHLVQRPVGPPRHLLATCVCVWCFSGLSSPHPAEIDRESSGHQASTCPSCTPPAADIAKSRLVCIVIDGRSVSPFSRHHSTQYSPSSPSLFSGAVNSSFGRRGRAAVRCVALQRVSPFSHTPDCRLSDCAGRLSWLTLLRKRTLKSA